MTVDLLLMRFVHLLVYFAEHNANAGNDNLKNESHIRSLCQGHEHIYYQSTISMLNYFRDNTSWPPSMYRKIYLLSCDGSEKTAMSKPGGTKTASSHLEEELSFIDKMISSKEETCVSPILTAGIGFCWS